MWDLPYGSDLWKGGLMGDQSTHSPLSMKVNQTLILEHF